MAASASSNTCCTALICEGRNIQKAKAGRTGGGGGRGEIRRADQGQGSDAAKLTPATNRGQLTSAKAPFSELAPLAPPTYKAEEMEPNTWPKAPPEVGTMAAFRPSFTASSNLPKAHNNNNNNNNKESRRCQREALRGVQSVPLPHP
jgi:hypothetical protein